MKGVRHFSCTAAVHERAGAAPIGAPRGSLPWPPQGPLPVPSRLEPVRRLLALLVLLLSVVLCSTASAKPVLGIADQKASTFDDPRLQALGLKYARYYVPWDVLKDKTSLAETDEWLAKAKSLLWTPDATEREAEGAAAGGRGDLWTPGG